MGVVVDKLQGIPLLHDHPLSQVTSDPGTGKVGQLILNTTDSTIKIWYNSTWQTLHTLTSTPPPTGGPMGISLGLANL